jgi:hypothetical protein
MPDQNPDAETALRKLGERLRHGHSIMHPAPENSPDVVSDAVRERHEQEQSSKDDKTAPRDESKEIHPKPDEPDQDR